MYYQNTPEQQPDYTRPDYYQESSYPPQEMQEYRGPQCMEGYTAEPVKEQQPAAEGGQKRGGILGLGAAILSVGAWLLKFKGLAFLLKFGWAGLSAVASIAIYSIAYGWQFAAGLVALLFIHEMGHAVAMKIKGIPIGPMIFVPMLGAAVIMKEMPRNAKDEAEVGIAGPVAGAISAGVCLLIAQWQPESGSLWAALAYFGFFLNLFNLLPVVPLDGGRVVAAIDKRIWVLGFVGLLAVQIWQWFHGNPSFWLLVIVLMAAGQFFARGGKAQTPEEQAYRESYYAVPLSSRILISVLYFGLAAVLYLGMSMAHAMILPY
ncbi:Zn-dependent protease [Thermosporothrix hazakensis]|uniref:Zn-dependent protease n=2 Tax=Thermosporothrix TaxID=768650 RepID=A0A326UBP5_THEHA|nr:site-2 protease family protein [Thermosporothrix hazakensis]PZW35917.1 Zn-dependent protease [Thermosporothrix hazakensis]BBH88384.1 hypothetical protein KTC_31350 [Thermosporothrix sp. COM3]GCE46571.1 hypothetical protein KTH_14400 [Thermosporothrix hazakensis]